MCSLQADTIILSHIIKTKKDAFSSVFPELVIGKGFEPLTHSLEGCCSIQLSYPTYLNCFLSKAMQKYKLFNLKPKFIQLFLKIYQK